jgi:hypothetical protein
MPAGTIIGIVVAFVIAVIGVVIVVAVARGISARTYRLKKRFGPEYDRLVAERPSRRLAESELAERERRVKGYSLRELSVQDQAQFRTQWADVQELFVDAPADAIGQGQRLVEQVMRDRGYPVTEFDQTLADLSVGHARVLDRFRAAHEASEKATTGETSTEHLRMALLDYREMFGDLLGAPAVLKASPAGNGHAKRPLGVTGRVGLAGEASPPD